MARGRTISAAERRRIARELERAARAAERDATKIVRELYESLRNLPPEEIIAALQAALPEYARRMTETITDGTARAAWYGSRLSQRTGVLGGGWHGAAEAQMRQPLRIRALGRLPARASDFLSPHIHRQGQDMVRGLQRTMETIMEQGNGALEAARRLRDETGHRAWVKITDVQDDVIRRGRAMMTAAGDPRAAEAFAKYSKEYKGYIAEYREYIGKLSPTARDFGMRASHSHFLDQLERAIKRNDAEAIERAKRWWLYDKQAYHQRMIARTQTAASFNSAFVEEARDSPWVVGFKWNVEEGGGRKRDICDVYGNQNLYGLGAGVYPFDKTPGLPAHPNCNCYLTEWIDESVGVDDQRPPAPPQRANADAEWLKKQPADVQREILGATRYEQFRAGGSRAVPPAAPRSRGGEELRRGMVRGPSYEEASGHRARTLAG